jgi:hypothetical protein
VALCVSLFTWPLRRLEDTQRGVAGRQPCTSEGPQGRSAKKNERARTLIMDDAIDDDALDNF